MNPADQLFLEAIGAKLFPGASLLVGKGPNVIYQKTFGHHTYEKGATVLAPHHFFDLGSLTKAIVTTSLCMLAHQEGLLNLHYPAHTFFSILKSKHPYRIEELLQHRSGLKDRLRFYLKVKEPYPVGTELEDFILGEILKRGWSEKKQGTWCYSDLNFILLGLILEKIYNEDLDEIFNQKIKKPLGLSHLFFMPLREALDQDLSGFVPTELCPWREKTLQGEVHDDNAYIMNGVAGHAGLFGTCQEIAHFLQLLLKSHKEKEDFISRKSWDLFLPTNTPHFLGWDRPSGTNSLSGKYFSPYSIGHLSFTGCSFWLDLKDEKFIILLTNRIFPTRGDKKLFNNFRIKIHNLSCEEFF